MGIACFGGYRTGYTDSGVVLTVTESGTARIRMGHTSVEPDL